MPPDYPDEFSQTRGTDLAPLKELEIQPSTIETIDRALFDYIDEELDIFCSTNKGFKKVPFIWAGAERAFQIKHNRELRDVNGWLIYPIMSIERTGISKDLTKRGSYYAAAMNLPDNKGGSMTVARTIKQDKTANFANADSKRLVLDGDKFQKRMHFRVVPLDEQKSWIAWTGKKQEMLDDEENPNKWNLNEDSYAQLPFPSDKKE